MKLHIKELHDEEGLKVGAMQWLTDGTNLYYWRFHNKITTEHVERMLSEIAGGKPPVGKSHELAANRYFDMATPVDINTLDNPKEME